jgi:prepilin-type N-terminal cleavage/methylation domain-containing protein
MSSIQVFSGAVQRTDDLIPCRCRASAGFTLIEVVLALTIFALMGTILYGAFSLGHSAVEKSEGSFTRNQKLRSVSDLLASYVRSAYPYRESEQDQSVYFSGEMERLSFVSAYSHGMGGRGMAKITIAKEQAGDGRGMLKLEESVPVRLSDEDGGAGQTHGLTIQDNIRDFRLAYLDPQADEEQWEDRWDAKERRTLPRAVRFTFIDENGKEVRWIFPLMMTVLAQ